MKIIIGTKNPAKISAVKNAFVETEAEFLSLDIPSEVSDQPFSDDETIQGAINRAQGALEQGNGDLGIGLEGGVQESKHGLLIVNWGALAAKGREPIIAGGARILLPEEVAVRLRAGEELGPVMEDFSNKENVRKKEGAIGIFTNGFINRDPNVYPYCKAASWTVHLSNKQGIKKFLFVSTTNIDKYLVM